MMNQEEKDHMAELELRVGEMEFLINHRMPRWERAPWQGPGYFDHMPDAPTYTLCSKCDEWHDERSNGDEVHHGKVWWNLMSPRNGFPYSKMPVNFDRDTPPKYDEHWWKKYSRGINK